MTFWDFCGKKDENVHSKRGTFGERVSVCVRERVGERVREKRVK